VTCSWLIGRCVNDCNHDCELVLHKSTREKNGGFVVRLQRTFTDRVSTSHKMISDLFIYIRTRKESRENYKKRMVELMARKELGKLREFAQIPGVVKAAEYDIPASEVLEYTRY
jgi:hypothetical protein